MSIAALLWCSVQPAVSPVGLGAQELILADHSRQSLSKGVRAAEHAFPSAAVVTEETLKFTSQSSELPMRNQPLGGILGGADFSLTAGRFPRGSREVAITPSAQIALRDLIGSNAALGGRIDAGFGRKLRIVGIVRDPRNYDSATLFVSKRVRLFASSVSVYAKVSNPVAQRFAGENPAALAVIPADEQVTDGMVGLGWAVGFALLVLTGLLAAIAFVISAKRRLREYGLLAAIGASTVQIRIVVCSLGALTGLIASTIGAILAWMLIPFFIPVIESFLGHSVQMAGVPGWLIFPPVISISAVTTLAAIYPAHQLSKISVVNALSGRPPAAPFTRRTTKAALMFVMFSVGAFYFGGASEASPVLFLAPLLAFISVLFLAPLAIDVVGRAANFGCTQLRFGVRDLARKRGASVILLATITAALTVPVTLLILSASAERQKANAPPKLPNNVLLLEELRGGVRGRSAVEPKLKSANHILNEMKKTFPNAKTSQIVVPVSDKTEVDRREYGTKYPVIESVTAYQLRDRPPRVPNDEPVWIATQDLLSALNGGTSTAIDEAGLVSSNSASLNLREPGGDMFAKQRPLPLRVPSADLFAPVWISPRLASEHKWKFHVAGWILVNDGPISPSDARTASEKVGHQFRVTSPETEIRSTSVLKWSILFSVFSVLALIGLFGALERVEFERDASRFFALGMQSRFLQAVVGIRATILTFIGMIGATIIGYCIWLADHLFSLEEPPAAFSIPLLAMLFFLPLVAGIFSAARNFAFSTENHLTE